MTEVFSFGVHLVFKIIFIMVPESEMELNWILAMATVDPTNQAQT